MYGITRNLSLNGHEVTVLSVNTPKHFQKDDVLNGIAHLKTVFIDTRLSLFKAFVNLFKPIPYIVERFISKDFELALIRLLQEEEFDVIHFEGTFVSWYVTVTKEYSKAPVVLRSHNVEYLIWERLGRSVANPLKKWYYRHMAEDLRRFEKEYYQKFDAVVAITPQDEDRIRRMGVKTKITYIPAGIDPDRFCIDREIKCRPNTCFILSALNWIPNQDALFWFLDHVFPEILKVNPQVELHVAGKGAPESILSLKRKNVVIHGFVDDAVRFMQEYDLMLVPLFAGGGMRLKIIEGMALEKTIIASSVGAEGIDCTDEKNILICDTLQEWVETITGYFTNPSQYLELEKEAGKLIREKYYNAEVIKRFEELYKIL